MSIKTKKNISKTKRVTCMDVARLAGVTIGSVSRVFNHASNVSADIHARVMQAAGALNYRPSAAARMLARQSHETIGLMMETEHVRTMYGAALIEGLTERLSESGRRLALGMVPWQSPAERLLDLPMLKTLSVDGLILDLAQIQGDIDAVVARLGVPYVSINPSGSRPYNAIMPDDVAVGQTATQYLIDRGHQRIAFISTGRNVHHSSGPDRMRGYARAMGQAELPLIPGWDEPVERIYAPQDEYAQRCRLYFEKHRCTAVVCLSTIEAMRMYIGALQMQARVPQDIALVACDVASMAEVFPLPMPSVHLDRSDMGRMAIDMLLERIARPGVDLPTVYYQGKMLDNVLTLFTGEFNEDNPA